LATQVFADDELERLRGFPEIGRDELARFFTLTPADVAFVDPGRGRGPADRLGLAVALCTLPRLGFVPDKVLSAPPVGVARLAEQLGVDPAGLRSYGRRAKTRTEHLRLVGTKGESLHALKRDLLYAHEGAIRARHLEAQTEQAWCLTLPQRLCESRQPLLQVAVEGLPVREDGSSGRGEPAMGAPLPVRG
jgi:hypothetical protein